MFATRSAAFAALRPTSQAQVLPFLAPCIGVRYASGSASKGAAKGGKKKVQKKKKSSNMFLREDMSNAETFALVDAMRYIRAFEVGRTPTSPKYDLAISLRTMKSTPPIRSRTKLPNVVDSSQRVAVICDPESPAGEAARAGGASLIGEDVIFDAIKAGRIEFEKCLCHKGSLEKLMKAQVARTLGPRGLMPSEKRGTVVENVKAALSDMIGGTEYREREGVVRVPIGQLRFSPEELEANVKGFMTKLKKDIREMSDVTNKEVHEVVLSSTHSPGFPLNGMFRVQKSIEPSELTVL